MTFLMALKHLTPQRSMMMVTQALNMMRMMKFSAVDEITVLKFLGAISVEGE